MVKDCRLVRPPYFGSGYMQLEHKGEIRTTSNPRSCMAEPSVFPILSGIKPRMINIWGNDYMINSFLSTAFYQNRVQKYLTAQEFPPALKKYMRTSCPGEICIRLLIPKVPGTSHNGEALLKVSAMSAPVVQTTAAEIKMTFPGNLTRGTPVQLNSEDVTVQTITMLVDVTLADNVVRGTVTAFTICISQIPSTFIGIITPNELQGRLDHFGNTYMVPYINEIAQKGMDIPHMPDTKLINHVLRKFKGGMMYAADVQWPSRSTRPATQNTSPSLRKLPACVPFTQP